VNFRRRSRLSSGFLDMTPFVDTIFNLLIFFALSMNFLANPGITVDLPSASAKEIGREDGDIRILITPEGVIHLDGAPVMLETLRSRFGEMVGGSRASRVLIRADAHVPHGLVVAVMDSAQAAGLERLAIVTRRKEPGSNR